MSAILLTSNSMIVIASIIGRPGTRVWRKGAVQRAAWDPLLCVKKPRR